MRRRTRDAPRDCPTPLPRGLRRPYQAPPPAPIRAITESAGQHPAGPGACHRVWDPWPVPWRAGGTGERPPSQPWASVRDCRFPGGLPDSLELDDPVRVPVVADGAGEFDVHACAGDLVVEAVELHDHDAVAGFWVAGDQAEPGVVACQPVSETP